MQRRAAAISVAFFLVVSAASYGLIATAEEPTVDFEDPDYSLSAGQSVELDGQEYTVTSIEATVESGGGGGHGGGGGGELVRSGEMAWTNESARYTASWSNGSSVTRDNQSFTVVVDSGEDPSGFTFREELNRTAILQDDPDAEDELATYNGSEWVVVREDGNRTLVDPEAYFPDPETREYEEGDSIEYENRTVAVDDVSGDQVTLAWTAPRENTISLSHESNVTIQDSTYLVFFPNNDTVYLTQDFQSYRTQTNQIAQHHDQVNGLWGVSIVSAVAAVIMLGLAYLPSRY